MARTRGCLWLTAGVVVAILAGVVAFLVLSRATGQPAGGGVAAGRTVPVVVAVPAVPVGTQLTAEMLQLIQVPVESTPEGAVGAVEDAVGKVTMVDLYPGEVILAQRLADPNVISGDGRTALVLSEGQVLMAFPANDLMSKSRVLKPGDHVDLLFSLTFPDITAGAEGGAEQLETFNLLQNVTIAALVAGETTTGGTAESAPEALLLTVDPQDALVLKHVKDAGGVMDIVLRAPGDTGPYETDPVDDDYLINRYEIPTGPGR